MFCEYDNIKTSKCEVKNVSIDKAINNAAASVEMEGFIIDEQCKEWCHQGLENKITMEQYIQLVLVQAGISQTI